MDACVCHLTYAPFPFEGWPALACGAAPRAYAVLDLDRFRKSASDKKHRQALCVRCSNLNTRPQQSN